MSNSIDNRMAWIRNIEKLKTTDSNSDEFEYEIASDVEIPGLLNYEDEMILCSQITHTKDKLGLYKFSLKIRIAQLDDPYNPDATQQGYFFKEGIPGELIALFSLYFQCRFYLLGVYTGNLTANSIKNKYEYPDIHRHYLPSLQETFLSNIKRNFANGLSDFLDQNINIPTEYHNALIMASYNYARALNAFGIDEEMVFVRLVSAIEALSKKKWVKVDDLFNGKAYEEIVKLDLLSGEENKKLKNLFDNRFVRHRFKQFIMKYSKGFFKGGNYKNPHTRIFKKDLSGVLDSVYNNRSTYLHDGGPMHLSIHVRGEEMWDIDPSFGMIIDNRRFTRRSLLPYGSQFQRLVRHCLLEFMKEKTEEVDKMH